MIEVLSENIWKINNRILNNQHIGENKVICRMTKCAGIYMQSQETEHRNTWTHKFKANLDNVERHSFQNKTK